MAGVRSEGLEKGRCQDRPSARPYLRVMLSPMSPILGELSTCLKPFQVTGSLGTASSCKALRCAGCWRGLRTPQAGGSDSQGASTPGQAHRRWGGERRWKGGEGHKETGPRHTEIKRSLERNQGEQQGEQGRGQVQPLRTTVMQVLEVKPHPPCDLVTPLLGVYIPET